MVSVKQTKQLLAMVISLLLIVSVVLKVSAGIGPGAAVIDTVMSGLQMDYTGISMVAITSLPVLIAKVLDAIVLPLLAILAATVFIGALDNLDIREKIVRSKIHGMKKHVILVPFNNYAEEIAEALAKEGIKSVVMAKTKKSLTKALEKGWAGVIGDTDEIDSFVAAGIDNAAFVVACDFDDMKNAITTITAKARSKSVKVISLVNDAANEDKMKILKVDAFVTPELVAGQDIVDGIVKNALTKSWTKE
jgi:voltage-gated potassium channel Kch